MKESPAERLQRYIDQILNEDLPSCEFTKLAVKRHLKDLEQGGDRGLRYNQDQADRFILWVEKVLVWTKGKRAGEPVILEDWQIFHFSMIFGWERYEDDLHRWIRRFNTSYLEIPRKNGKTTMAAAVANYMAFFDGERRAQVYIAATKAEQANICLRDAQSFVTSSPVLNSFLGVYRNSIYLKKKDPALKPIHDNYIQRLASDSDTLDGLDVHASVIDELHAHKDPHLTNVIRTATGARSQPLVYEITTAGYNKESICYQHRDLTIRILKGEIQDDSWMGMIFTVDKGDDITDPEVWIKANPNLGVSKYKNYLKRQLKEAENDSSHLPIVERYDFNIWNEEYHSWIPSDTYAALADPGKEPKDDPAVRVFAGLDLASNQDFNALSLLWVKEKPLFTRTFFWIPEGRLKDRVEKLATFKKWKRDGWITTLPGSTVDHQDLLPDLVQAITGNKVERLGYDKWNAHPFIIPKLQEEYGEKFTQPVGMGIGALSLPTKDLEKALLSGDLFNDGNPVMNWQVNNAKVYVDPNENVKLHKKKSEDKIDGPVSLTMAYAVWMQWLYEGGDQDDSMIEII